MTLDLSANTLPSEDATRNKAKVQQTDEVRKLVQSMSSRINSLDKVRLSWWKHWGQLARLIMPRRYEYLVTPDRQDRGGEINQAIINSTATKAARDCASGIMSGFTSPSDPWFRITVQDAELEEDQDVQEWCEEVTKRILRVMSGSGYYNAKGVQYLDLVVFGTAPLIIYEDAENVIRCFNPVCGEYYCAVGPNNTVETLARRFTMTISQMVNEFGVDNLSTTAKALWETAQNSTSLSTLDQELIIEHIIEPNPDYDSKPVQVGRFGLPRHFKYREVYWESGSPEMALRLSGFSDKPFSCPRWDVQGNQAYGRSPAMDALGDIKQLQQEEKSKAKGLDKMVDPPMVADASMKNEPASLLPGAVTYVPRMDGSAGFKAAIDVRIPIGELKDDIRNIETRIQATFFVDLFMAILGLTGDRRTATEIAERKAEKLIMLGPVLDRIQQEGITPDISRIYQIMARGGYLPRPPQIMRGLPLKVAYISPLADLQRAAQATSIERWVGFTGSLGSSRPEAMDNVDVDEVVKQYGTILRVSPKLMTPKDKRDAMRAARSQQQQDATTIQTGAEAVNAGKVLSETDVGGGQNALSMILNGGS